MTLKNAIADTAFGGGKSVIGGTSDTTDRTSALSWFGRYVAQLGGTYLPAADLGTSIEDVQTVLEAAPDLAVATCDTSMATAIGVWATIAAAVSALEIRKSLTGVSVCVQGAGHVGERLALLLAADGATVVVADVDQLRARRVAMDVGGHVVDSDLAVECECDVLAPCATAQVITLESIQRLNCALVAGAANDVLADRSCADLLAKRGIGYVPDFVASAGGVIQVRAAMDGWSDERLRQQLHNVGSVAAEILIEARSRGMTTLDVGESLAYAKLRRGQRSNAPTPGLST